MIADALPQGQGGTAPPAPPSGPAGCGLYEAILQNAPFGGIVASTLPDGRCVYLNPEFTRLTGYTLADIPTVGDWLLLAYPEPAYRARVLANWESDVDPGNMGRDVVYEVACRDGTRRPMQLRASRLGEELMFVMVLDLSEGLRHLEELKAERARLQAAIESLPFDFFALDLEGRHVLQNSACRAHWGDLIGRRLEEIEAPAEAMAAWSENNLRAFAGATATGEVEFPVHGERRSFYTVVNPILVEGRTTGVVGINIDITEHRRAERERAELAERLRQSEKLEAIGQLAGGVAHDFNNLLTAIEGHAELLEAELRERPAEHAWVQRILRSAERAAELTRQLLAFSRREKPEFAPLDVHDCIRDVQALLSRTIDRRIETRLDLRAPRPRVRGDASQFHMVLVNLALNARDAMPEGGLMTFATRNVRLDGGLQDGYRDPLPPGDYLEICLSDTGCGMDEEVLEHVFEPFFTTKAADRGTGLGLASAYGSVRSHEGSMKVVSRRGEGSTFSLLVPTTDARAPQGPGPEAVVPGGGGGHVLVVDDEEVVRDLVTTWMRRLGYRVSTCRDGAEAVAFFGRHLGHVDLVVLNLVMPRMGGAEAFRALRSLDPGIPIVLCSGYSRDEAVSALLAEDAVAFLAKPFRLHELTALVSDLLARSAPT